MSCAAGLGQRTDRWILGHLQSTRSRSGLSRTCFGGSECSRRCARFAGLTTSQAVGITRTQVTSPKSRDATVFHAPTRSEVVNASENRSLATGQALSLKREVGHDDVGSEDAQERHHKQDPGRCTAGSFPRWPGARRPANPITSGTYSRSGPGRHTRRQQCESCRWSWPHPRRPEWLVG